MIQESSVSQTTLGTVLQPRSPAKAMPKPAALTPEDFRAYPVGARELAGQRLALLRTLPLPLLPILLREISTFDWKFPAERRQITGQLNWLSTTSPTERQAIVDPFARLGVTVSDDVDWINDPAAYLEQLTAVLWSTNSMPAFRNASEQYADALRKAVPPMQPSRPRVCIVALDAAMRDHAGKPATFAALRQHGVTLTGLSQAGDFSKLLGWVNRRSAVGSVPQAYTHWYVDGGTAAQTSLQPGKLAIVDYDALDPVRQKLLQRAQQVMTSKRSGPEELRTLMAHFTPSDLGLPLTADPVLTRFQLSLLTEGSGTQVFATTFVQWAAREVLRRAEPETMLLRFRPRQRQQGMNELLSGVASLGPDLAGSMIDAEQGAYYTWLNLMRLPGAEQAYFLVWQEGGTDAVMIGPGLARGTTSPTHSNLNNVLDWLT